MSCFNFPLQIHSRNDLDPQCPKVRTDDPQKDYVRVTA